MSNVSVPPHFCSDLCLDLAPALPDSDSSMYEYDCSFMIMSKNLQVDQVCQGRLFLQGPLVFLVTPVDPDQALERKHLAMNLCFANKRFKATNV